MEPTEPVNRMLDPERACHRFAEDISVHWWSPPVEEGTPCQCGEVLYAQRDDDSGS